MEFFEERQDSEPAPRARAQPAAGPSGHTGLGVGLGPPAPASPTSPETQLLAGLRLSRGQAGSSSLPAGMPPCIRPPGTGLLGVRALSAQPLFPQTSTQGSPAPPTLTFALKAMWGKGPGWGPEAAHPLPPAHRQRVSPPSSSQYRCRERQAPLPCGFLGQRDPKHSPGSPASKTSPNFSLPSEIPRTHSGRPENFSEETAMTPRHLL